MMLTLRGLPPDIEVSEIRSYTHARCAVGLVLLDELEAEAGGTRRVTMATMSDADGATLRRALSGERLRVCTLLVEPYRAPDATDINFRDNSGPGNHGGYGRSATGGTVERSRNSDIEGFSTSRGRGLGKRYRGDDSIGGGSSKRWRDSGRDDVLGSGSGDTFDARSRGAIFANSSRGRGGYSGRHGSREGRLVEYNDTNDSRDGGAFGAYSRDREPNSFSGGSVLGRNVVREPSPCTYGNERESGKVPPWQHHSPIEDDRQVVEMVDCSSVDESGAEDYSQLRIYSRERDYSMHTSRLHQQEPKGDTKKLGRPAAPAKAKESTKSSDDEQAPAAKRGRGRPKGSSKKKAAPKAKGDTKKLGRPAAPAKAKESTKSSDDEQAPAAKRGRGRPKGSSKKKAAPKLGTGNEEDQPAPRRVVSAELTAHKPLKVSAGGQHTILFVSNTADGTDNVVAAAAIAGGEQKAAEVAGAGGAAAGGAAGAGGSKPPRRGRQKRADDEVTTANEGMEVDAPASPVARIDKASAAVPAPSEGVALSDGGSVEIMEEPVDVVELSSSDEDRKPNLHAMTGGTSAVTQKAASEGSGKGRGRPRKEAPPKKDAAFSDEEQDGDEEDEGSDQ